MSGALTGKGGVRKGSSLIAFSVFSGGHSNDQTVPDIADRRGRMAWTRPGLDSLMSLSDYARNLVRDDNGIELRCSA